MTNYKSTILLTLLCCILEITSCTEKKADTLSETGVSYELAELRARNISHLKYELYFHIPQSSKKRIEASENITFNLDKTGYGHDLYLDFKEKTEYIHSLEANGERIKIQHRNEHIIIPSDFLKDGKNTIKINFRAGEMSLNRNEDYLYTLLVPDRARTLFPCFDQPNLKARYSLTLDIPEDWEAVANAPEIKIRNNRKGHPISLDRNSISAQERDHADRTPHKLVHFTETEPLSTYLFSFVVGNFQVSRFQNTVQKHPKVKSIGIYHRETDPQKTAQLKAIADEVFQSLKWLEHYTDIPYPFAKYDLVILPGFQFGGMEHSGATLYNASAMLLPEHPNIDLQLRRSHLIAHETAHMWFGDYVTMDWFSGVWIKEVFANFLASLITRPLYPDIDFRITDLNFNIRAYEDDRTPGATTIEQTLPNLKYAGLIYNNIIYQKSPVFLNKLYHIIGPNNFRKSIREYLNTYAYGNASWKDLEEIFIKNEPEDNKGTETDLKTFSQKWIYGKGMPTKSFSIKDESSADINEIPNLDGEYYGYIDFNDEALNVIINELYKKEKNGNFYLPAYSRKSLLMMLYESWEKERLSNEKFLRVIISYLYEEKDPQIFPMLVKYITTVAEHSMDDPANLYTEEVELAETALYRYIHDSSNPQYAKAAFKAVSKISQSHEILSQIYKIWNGEEQVENITLNGDDLLSLAYELAFKLNNGISFIDGIRPEDIIQRQAERISNPDKQREFAYISRVCYGSDSQMDKLFESLLDEKNRTTEPWTCQVLAYLNHPLRQEKALQYIVPGLKELPEIQATGDIFFPSDWCKNLLSGHKTQESQAIVQRFLNKEKALLPLLKNKILLYI